DDDGRLIAIEDAAGKLTRFLHSPGSNLEMVVDRLGYTNSYLYDVRGNIIWTTNALKEVTRMAYDDPFNPDLKTAETNAFGTSQQTGKLYGYDSYGNKTKIVD